MDVPPAQWTISTPVNLPMGACVRIDWHSYPHHIVCATRGKPVFECIGGKRHWRILGGCFYGSGSGTPSCFLLCGRDDATGQQCGDIGLLSQVQTSGSWGIACLVNISGEILNFQDCNFWMQGRGDMNWGGAKRHHHHCERRLLRPALQLHETQHARQARAPPSSFRTATSEPTHITTSCSRGRSRMSRSSRSYMTSPSSYGQIVVEPSPNGGCPRRLYLGGGGRTENNTGSANAGCPVILVDGQNKGGAGLYECTIGAMGFFVGGAMSHSTPVLKAVNGGVIYGLTWDQGGHIEHTNVLIDHRTADLQWASIRSRFNAHIECSGRSIHHSTIRIGGEVRGNIGTKTKVFSANQNNW